MHARTRIIAAVAAVTAALGAAGGAALAHGGSAIGATTGTARTDALVETLAAVAKPGLQAEKPNFDAVVAAVASSLHVSTARVSAALSRLFADVTANSTSSPAFAAAASSLGVSTQQLGAALTYAKQSLGQAAGQPKQNLPTGIPVKQGPPGSGTAPPPSVVRNEIVAAVASQLHASTAEVSAALQTLFATGQVDPTSPAFAAAAQSLGVSTQQLNAALMYAKQSLAPGH